MKTNTIQLSKAAALLGRKGGRVTASKPGHMLKAVKSRWDRYRVRKAAGHVRASNPLNPVMREG